MGWPDSPPSNMRCCGGDKKDSRPLVPGPQLPGKLHAALASIQMSRQNRLNHAPFRIMASRFSVLEKGLPSCSTFRPRRISSCMAQIPPCMGAERVRSIQQVDAEEKLCPWNGRKTASNLPL